MNVVDSSAWLEYFADGPNAGFFAPAVEDPASQIVPTLTIYEVFKRILQQRSDRLDFEYLRDTARLLKIEDLLRKSLHESQNTDSQ